jgi:hypothetical protein
MCLALSLSRLSMPWLNSAVIQADVLLLYRSRALMQPFFKKHSLNGYLLYRPLEALCITLQRPLQPCAQKQLHAHAVL